jgi:3-hydroxyacyl-[acyl-carrier-protein] dehydratase
MADLAGSSGALSARFVFPEDFIGFQGHFPAKKILPGVCQIQCVLSMLEEHGKKPMALKEIVLVKFFNPVSPGEELSCQCKDVQDGGGDFTVKAVMQRGNQKISEMKLRVCYR